MANISREIVVSPLFYDTLSGEFVPSTDPEKRKHTLGRLTIAAVQKGEMHQVGRMRRDFEYEPSWAPGILATAVCSHVAEDNLGSHENEVLSLAGIDLANTADGSTLTVIEEKDGLRIIENEILFSVIPLALGPDIASARRVVTDRTFAFFKND